MNTTNYKAIGAAIRSSKEYKNLMAAKMIEILGGTKDTVNNTKKRMLEATFGKEGLRFPEDWDSLSEEEKEKRLNGALEVLK